MEYSSAGDPVELGRLFEKVEAVVVSAPTPTAALQETALEHGCHVVDVGIQGDVVAALLSLDAKASEAGRYVIAAGGLAPGLTGLLGSDLLKATPGAAVVDVCLIQSARGTAGLRGTQDMLDLLTREERRDIRPMVVSGDLQQAGSAFGGGSRIDQAGSDFGARRNPRLVRRRAFVLPTPESAYLPNSESIGFYTLFDSAHLNGALRMLRGIRGVNPRLYQRLAHLVARKKAAAAESDSEEITLSAVALDSDGAPVAWRALRFSSDYGATAAIAAGAARGAVAGSSGEAKEGAGDSRPGGGEVPPGPGAGLLGRFFSVPGVLGFEAIRSVLLSSGPGP